MTKLLLTIFLLLPLSLNANISELTGSAYNGAVQLELEQKLNLKKNVWLEEVTSGSYSEFHAPNLLHDPGRLHSAIFRYTRDRKPRLVKTIYPGLHLFISDEHFKRDVFGMLLASHIGGPEVIRAGRIKASDGQVGYFIEMEEVFPGITDSYTFKGIGGDAGIINPLTESLPSDFQLQKVAKFILLSLERGISIGVDPDLIFSGEDVRWIDTTDWRIEKFDISALDFDGLFALHNYGDLLTKFLRLEPRAGRLIAYTLQEEIKKSWVWSPSEKAGVISNLRTVLVDHWNWSESDHPNKSLVREQLMPECRRVFSKP